MRSRRVLGRCRAVRARLQVQQPYGGAADVLHDRRRQPPARHRRGRAVRCQGGGQLTRRGAGGRVLGQARGHQLPQRARQLRGQLGFLVHDLVQQGRRGVAGERRDAGRGEGEHGAQGEDVRGPVDALAARLAEDLLGRHVAGRADGHAGGGQGGGAVGGAGDPEVDEPGAVQGEQHVGRLDVAVDEPEGVDGGERLREPGAQGPHGPLGQRPVGGDRLGERRPGDIAGGDPRDGRLRVGVQDGRGPPGADPPGGGDLAAEPLPELLVQREVRVHDLHGHGPAALGAGQVDPAHAARAEPAEQSVGTDDPRFVRIQRLHVPVLPDSVPVRPPRARRPRRCRGGRAPRCRGGVRGGVRDSSVEPAAADLPGIACGITGP